MDSSSPASRTAAPGPGHARAPALGPPRPRSPLRFVVGANFVACTVIAIALWALVPSIGRYGFLTTFVHSQAIGQSIGLAVMASRRLFGLTGTSPRWLQYALLPPIIVLAFVAGNWIAHLLLGIPGSPLRVVDSDRELIASLATTVIAAVIGTWFFTTREEITSLRIAAAEEARRAEEAHRRASDARLAMLRAQVEPHMLFNTLANLRALIGADPVRAREMLDRLIALLRATLGSSRAASATLADEFALLDNYLALMRIRMGDRLQYTLAMAPGAGAEPVPSLLLQPLVENAIRHGIEPAVDGGRVDVDARIEDGQLVVRVRDTGVGFDAGAGAVAAPPTDATHDGGFGIASLRERLAVLSPAARLDIVSPLPEGAHGTLATVRLPAGAQS